MALSLPVIFWDVLCASVGNVPIEVRRISTLNIIVLLIFGLGRSGNSPSSILQYVQRTHTRTAASYHSTYLSYTIQADSKLILVQLYQTVAALVGFRKIFSENITPHYHERIAL